MFNDALLRGNATRLNNLAWAALTGEDRRETSGLEYSVPFDQIRDMCLDAPRIHADSEHGFCTLIRCPKNQTIWR